MKAVKPLNAVVLLSGSGTTFQHLYDEARQGALALNIKGVMSSKRGAYGLTRARAVGIPTQTIPRSEYLDARSFSRELIDTMNAMRPEIVVMAGFTALLHLPDYLLGKVINIHPSLLPKFGGKGMYGIRVHRAVIAARAKESGCTVHYVDNEYDHGPVILQKKVEVRADDTPEKLDERVRIVEREALPEAINMIADGRVRWENGKAVFDKSK